MKTIRLDGEGDGAWIAALYGGIYNSAVDHSFCSVEDEVRLGGFVFCNFNGHSIEVHNGGVSPTWCSRDLLWMIFDWAFRRIKVRRVFTTVRTSNHRALAIDLRAGFQIETLIRDVYPDDHLFVLSITPETCPFLKLTPKRYKLIQE